MERIAAAAIKAGDRIFTGPVHWAAEDKIQGTDVEETVPCTLWDYGFVTNLGRFVTRHEAASLARVSGQIRNSVYSKHTGLDLCGEDLYN